MYLIFTCYGCITRYHLEHGIVLTANSIKVLNRNQHRHTHTLILKHRFVSRQVTLSYFVSYISSAVNSMFAFNKRFLHYVYISYENLPRHCGSTLFYSVFQTNLIKINVGKIFITLTQLVKLQEYEVK